MSNKSNKLDRPALAAILERLGDEDDAQALAAAREAHAVIGASDVTWDDLLHVSDTPSKAKGAPRRKSPDGTLDDAGVHDLIDQLLARPDTSEALRDELEGYRRDIAEGEFDYDDRVYLKALYDRLILNA